MREIKFRAWDKLESLMLDHKEIFANFRSQIANFDAREYDLFKQINYIFTQFTGLKDKNGKEIYEGDIVKSVSSIHNIIWDNGRCGFNVNNYMPEGGVEMITNKLEVIGNIYENPELLNENIK